MLKCRKDAAVIIRDMVFSFFFARPRPPEPFLAPDTQNHRGERLSAWLWSIGEKGEICPYFSSVFAVSFAARSCIDLIVKC